MDERQARAREVEKRYEALRRQKQREKIKKKLPRYALMAAMLLICLLLAILLLTYRQLHRETPEALHVLVLDVGQGDAILLRSEGHAMLIDAGNPDNAQDILQTLSALGIQKLDYLMNTHPHADHIGGMRDVLSGIPTGTLLFPQIPEALLPTTRIYEETLETAEACNVPVRFPGCHDRLTLGRAEVEFLCVDNSAFTELNSCSLACSVTCDGVSLFFGGDMTESSEAAFLAEGLVQPAMLYKVSHHGSATSSSQPFLDVLCPQIAVISCGTGNDYGHPAPSCLTRLDRMGTAVFRTDTAGALLFSVRDGALQVRKDYHPK